MHTKDHSVRARLHELCGLSYSLLPFMAITAAGGPNWPTLSEPENKLTCSCVSDHVMVELLLMTRSSTQQAHRRDCSRRLKGSSRKSDLVVNLPSFAQRTWFANGLSS